MTHELKCWLEPFQAVLGGYKTHEVRIADRPFKVGDILWLREFNPSRVSYTGRECRVAVSYVTEPGSWGLPHDRVVLSIKLIPEIREG